MSSNFISSNGAMINEDQDLIGSASEFIKGDLF